MMMEFGLMGVMCVHCHYRCRPSWTAAQRQQRWCTRDSTPTTDPLKMRAYTYSYTQQDRTTTIPRHHEILKNDNFNDKPGPGLSLWVVQDRPSVMILWRWCQPQCQQHC